MTTGFDILPAIDLRGGRVVRLRQGDFAAEQVFADDPVLVARTFAAGGARWLHVVDLDGARAGHPVQAEVIAAIAGAAGESCRVEAGGGLRTAAGVAATLARGAARVALGTAAIADAVALRRLLTAHGSERIVVAVDVRDGVAIGDAWQSGAAGLAMDDLIRRAADAGAVTFEVTAVDRDGLMGGPDLRILERAVGLGRGAIIASGGIRSTADLRAVRDLGCAGAIVGRALYDGSLRLEDALAT